MSLKLSSSSIRMYSECGRKYELHYVKRLRSKVIGGALLFGSAIDNALNDLLKNKDIEAANETFRKMWSAQNINGELEVLSKSHKVVYSDKDFDEELLDANDKIKFSELQLKYDYLPGKTLSEVVKVIKEKKSENGLQNVKEEERTLLSYANWLCMAQKGKLMIKGYHDKVLPQIEEVIEVQKNFSVKNPDGDSIIGLADIILKLKNGDVYLMDNKTSTRQYANDSARKSQQLILYYHVLKAEYNLKGVGFFVLQKQMKKNRVKICSVCHHDGTGGRHKTCDNITIEGGRCCGAWNETVNPEADIYTILNDVSESGEKLVMDMFNSAKKGINNEVYQPNLLACGDTNSDYRCPFYNICWNGSSSDVVSLGDKKEEKKLDERFGF
jgi:hypothetical protein